MTPLPITRIATLLFCLLVMPLAATSDVFAPRHNPFGEGIQPNYLIIAITQKEGTISYLVNDREMAIERVDHVLGRLADIDRNQTIVVELRGETTPSVLGDITALLMKHEFRHVARRGTNDEPIWITDDSWMKQNASNQSMEPTGDTRAGDLE